MKTAFHAFFFTVILMLAAASTASASVRCQSLMDQVVPYQYNLPRDLRAYREYEAQNRSVSEINRLNRETLSHLTSFVPAPGTNKARALNLSDAKRLLQVVADHPVTGHNAYSRYNRPDVQIGFCFGRASFIHLMLLKMGLSRDSIVKVWVVGPMRTPGVVWDFHVATAAYVKDKGWMVLDTNYNDPMPLQNWYNKMQEQNRTEDRKLRFYVTEPNKFGLDTGKYDRIQLGLDLNRENDWYQHYFVDMMSDLSSRSLADYGLRRLPVEAPSSSAASVGSASAGTASPVPPAKRSLWDRLFRR